MAAESSSRTAARQSRTKTSSCTACPAQRLQRLRKGIPEGVPFSSSLARSHGRGYNQEEGRSAHALRHHGCVWQLFLTTHSFFCLLLRQAFGRAPCSSDLRHTARRSSMLLHIQRQAAPRQGVPQKAVLCQKPGRALPYREPGGARPRRESGKVLPCMSLGKAAASP